MGMGVRSTLYHVRICDFAEYRTDYYVDEEIAGTLRHRATSIHKLLFINFQRYLLRLNLKYNFIFFLYVLKHKIMYEIYCF